MRRPLAPLALALPLLAACTCGGADAGHVCVPCAHACVDLATDPENCGACGVTCESGYVCEAARCVEACPAGLRFVWPRTRSLGRPAAWLALADVNGDGRADLVAPGETGGVSMYPGALGARFEDPVGLGALGGREAIAGLALPPVDDGGARIAVLLDEGRTLAILAGSGVPPIEFALRRPADRLLSGDVDGDGALELVAADGEAVTVLRGGDDGTFTAGAPAELPGAWTLLADVDGDGAADLVDTGVGEVARGDRQGGFAAPVAVGWPVVAGDGVAAADLDGDRRAEVLVPCEVYDDRVGHYRSFVAVLRFDGDRFITVDEGDRADGGPVTVADLDGDGRPEVVATGDWVDVFRVEAGATLVPEARYLPSLRFGLPAVGDVNGDGLPDLVGADDFGIVPVLRGRTGGRLGAAERLPTGGAAGADIADVDGDGRPEVIALASASLVVVPGAEGGGFGEPRTLPLPAGGLALERLGPAAGGGRSLAVLLDDWTVATVAPAAGSFTLTGVVPLEGGKPREQGSMTVADLDGDGLLDVAVESHVFWKLWLLRGQADGTLALARVVTQDEAFNSINGSLAMPIAAVDFDGDGRLDLVHALQSEVIELSNLGDFAFRRTRFDMAPAEIVTLAPYDVDADGRAELAVSYAGRGMDTEEDVFGVAVLAAGRGDLPEVARLAVREAFDARALATPDLDGDGDADLVAADRSEGVAVFENTGGLHFGERLDLEAGEWFGGEGRIGVGDLDGDGRLDLALPSARGVELVYGGCR